MAVVVSINYEAIVKRTNKTLAPTKLTIVTSKSIGHKSEDCDHKLK